MRPVQAAALARQLHAGQVDRAGAPYIAHLERVVGHLVRRWPDASDDELCAAWLHDALEDTDATAASLLAHGVSPEAVAMVSLLTKPKGAAYLPWIASLASTGNRGVVRVKLADNADNQDPARNHPDRTEMQDRKYRPAAAILEAALSQAVFRR